MHAPLMVRDFIFCLFVGLTWKLGWRFLGLPIVQQRSRNSIEIGKNFTAISNPKCNSVGVFQKVILKTLTPKARIKIGNNVGLSGCSICARNYIEIGNDVLIGSGVLIVDNDAHPVSYEDRKFNPYNVKSSPVVVEDGVFIGARAIILKGVTIGKGAVVGAGAVVTKSVEAGSIVCGNPAKVFRK
jgi:acetyltransferase-like isoleucine patch superfamily enzyme